MGWPEYSLTHRQRQKVQQKEPAVAQTLRTRKARVLTFELPFRPMALKNSRAYSGASYTIVNSKARVRLEAARWQLREQHRGGPLTGCYDLSVTVWYSDMRSWLDSDAVATFAMDALKGVVIVDDSPKYLRDCTGKSRLSRQKLDHMEIELREVL